MIFSIFTVITWSIIMPIDSAGLDDGRRSEGGGGLDIFTWGNIPGDVGQDGRYVAHVVVVWILTGNCFKVYQSIEISNMLFNKFHPGIVIYLIRREFFHFIHLRHEWLISDSHSRLPQARTVMITMCPEEFDNERSVKIWASLIPGGVYKIWIYRDTRVSSFCDQTRGETDIC
jgi:calcium permeable stress-gated cation channel